MASQPSSLTAPGRLALLLPRPTQDPSAGKLSLSRAALAAPKGTWMVASSPAQLTLTPSYYGTASGSGQHSTDPGMPSGNGPKAPGTAAPTSTVLSSLTLCVQLQGPTSNNNSIRGGPQGGQKPAPAAGPASNSSSFTFTSDLLDSRHAVKLLLPKGIGGAAPAAAAAGIPLPEQAQTAAAVLLVSPVSVDGEDKCTKPANKGVPGARGVLNSTQPRTHTQQQASSNTSTWPWAPQPPPQQQPARKPQLPTATTRPLVTQPLQQPSQKQAQSQTVGGPVLAFLFTSRADAEQVEGLLVYAASDPPAPPPQAVHGIPTSGTQVQPQQLPSQQGGGPGAHSAQLQPLPPTHAPAMPQRLSTQQQEPVAKPPLSLQPSLVPAKRPALEAGLGAHQPLHMRLPTAVTTSGSRIAGGAHTSGMKQPPAGEAVLAAGQPHGNRPGLQAAVASMAAGLGTGGSSAAGTSSSSAAHAHAFNELIKVRRGLSVFVIGM
jgi:hypothetical protein